MWRDTLRLRNSFFFTKLSSTLVLVLVVISCWNQPFFWRLENCYFSIIPVHFFVFFRLWRRAFPFPLSVWSQNSQIFQPTDYVLLTCPHNFLSFNTLWYSKIVYIHLVFSLLQYWGFFGWGGSGSFGDTHIPFWGELAKLLKSLASLYTIFLTETSFWARLSLLILLYILSKIQQK